MQKIIPLFLILLVLAGCTAPVQQRAEYRQIGMDEAVTMMEAEADCIILDVRTVAEYQEKHIPGAINIPNDFVEQGLNDRRCEVILVMTPQFFDARLKGTLRFLAKFGKRKVIFVELNEVCKLITMSNAVEVM